MRSYNKFVYRIKNPYSTTGGIKKENPTHMQYPPFVHIINYISDLTGVIKNIHFRLGNLVLKTYK